MTTIKYLDSKRLEQESAYKVHTFTEGGTFTVTGSGDVEYLVVGGGGGGFNHGSAVGSAGGAGALRTNLSGATNGGGTSLDSTYGVTAQNYTITVGAGGAVSTQGGDSSIVPASGTTITSNGGAEGVTVQTNGATNGNASGSGAGAAYGGTQTGGAGGTYGNNGGNTHNAYWYSSAGGGGSSTVGGNSSGGVSNGDGAASAVAGNGGNGTSNSITGSALTYAGGGGGAPYDTTGTKGTGGSGIGGDGGGSGVTDATAGDTNTGSGGGGCTYSGSGAGGGSGIVIIRYLTSSSIVATGGTVTVTDGLVAQLKFNDDVTDTYGNNGTVTGTETYVAGKIDKAFSFNGSSYITLANESNFDFERTDPFSIAFWVNMGNNTNKMLMCKGDDPYSAGTTSGISIWTQADWLDVNINASSSQFIRVRTAIASIEDSTWHHVTVAYDGSSAASGLTIYYDGVSQSLSTVSDTLTSSSILNNYPFLIGDSGAGSRDWTGKLDDLRIYDRELTQGEVNIIYNGGTGTESESPSSVQDNSVLVEKYTGRRYWGSNSTVKVSDIEDKTLVANGSGIGYSGAYIDINIPNFASYTGDYRLRTLDTTITTTDFVLDFDWWRQGSNNPPNTSAGLVLRSSQSGLSIENSGITSDDYIRTNANDAGTTLEFLWHSAGTSTETSIGTIAVGSIQAWKYMRLTRTDATTLKFEQFSSEARTGSATLTVNYTSLPSSWGLGLKYIGGYCSDANAGGGLHERLQNIDLSSTSNGTLTTWNSRFRGIFAGGADVNGNTSTMEYISIASPSNASAFGNLSQPLNHFASVHSDVRGVFCGGISSANTDAMEYITIATLGNTSPFGTLNASMRTINGVSSDVRGIIGGGDVNTTQYITIATLGNGLNFGNITTARKQMAGVSSDVRGIFAGGGGAAIAVSNEMDYFTIATASTAGDFGDLSVARKTSAGINSDVRGVFCGGTYLTICDYVTIATEGNATTFGDLSQTSYGGYGVSSDVRGVVTFGWTVGAESSKLDYITIPTLGNSNNFGDLSVAKIYESGVSGQ